MAESKKPETEKPDTPNRTASDDSMDELKAWVRSEIAQQLEAHATKTAEAVGDIDQLKDWIRQEIHLAASGVTRDERKKVNR
jgi:hypothetical protein